MKYKQLKFIAVLLLGLGLTGLQAQTMNVKEMGGTETSYSLSEISKITFSSGNLTILETDNNSVDYALTNLRYLNFSSTITEVNENFNTEISQLKIYPNPTKDILNIDFQEIENPIGIIKIHSLEGRLIETLAVESNNIVTLDLSQLSNGIYLCHYINDKEIKTVKIIKQ